SNMAALMNTSHLLKRSIQLIAILIVFTTSRLQLATEGRRSGKLGVDYGFNGNNLISPEKTVALLKSIGITRVKMYEPRQEVLKAFADSGIQLLLGIPNDLVPAIAANLALAFSWVAQNVVPFPKSKISTIIVGNEWLLDPAHDPSLLLPAMNNVYTALTTTSPSLSNVNLSAIKVSTTHSFRVLSISFPPSAAQFNPGLLPVLIPILTFLQLTRSSFMVNIFPYFAYVEDSNVSLDFALFQAKEAVRDPNTGLDYTNLFDLQLDAVYAAVHGVLALAGVKSLGEKTGRNYDYIVKEEQGEDNARRPIPSLNKTGREYDQIEKHANSGRRWPHVVAGESGWPSDPHGGSGSGPSSQLESTDQYPAHSCGHRHVFPSPHCPLQPAAPAGAAQQQSGDDVIPGAAAGRGAPADAVLGAQKVTCAFSERVCAAATKENARTYNQNLIRHVLNGRGPPANPSHRIHAFIFALFDENLKQPPGPEQHYGLFYPNGKPVYPITFHL
ncbi:hypothetical protein GOP47_0028003, partial [Adiantum capillus-veneris]